MGLVLGVVLVAAMSRAAEFLPGDVNDDKVFDIVDGTVLRRDLVGLPPGISQMCLAQPTQTGQVTCWDSAGSVISCTATGHDGDLRAGLMPAYQDNGDGTITDLKTGLMWEKLADDGSTQDQDDLYTWDDAFSAKVGLLNFTSYAGHDDWRVPNPKELIGILDLQTFDPAVGPAFENACTPACTVTTCSCTAYLVTQGYWSSSSDAGSTADAWLVDFSDGSVSTALKTGTASVRAVRGPGDGISCSTGQARSCGIDLGECVSGVESCVADAWSGICVGEIPPSSEVCDGLDNDCNGIDDDPGPPDLCPLVSNAASAVCAAGSCQVGSCDATWHDLNLIYADGCECQEDANDQAGLGNTCAAAVNLGSLPDDGSSFLQVTGNIATGSGSDWYRVTLLDTSDSLRATIHFTSNPSVQFRMRVLRDGCPGAGGSQIGIDCANVVWEGFPGSDDTSNFFIEVFRPVPVATCDSYTLEIRSDPPTGSFTSQCNG